MLFSSDATNRHRTYASVYFQDKCTSLLLAQVGLRVMMVTTINDSDQSVCTHLSSLPARASSRACDVSPVPSAMTLADIKAELTIALVPFATAELLSIAPAAAAAAASSVFCRSMGPSL